MKYLHTTYLLFILLTQIGCRNPNKYPSAIESIDKETFDHLYSLRMKSNPYFYAVPKDSIDRYFYETDSLKIGTYVAFVDSKNIFYKAATIRELKPQDTTVTYVRDNTIYTVPLSMFLEQRSPTDSVVYLQGKTIYVPRR